MIKDEIEQMIVFNEKKSPSGFFYFAYLSERSIKIEYFSFEKFKKELEEKIVFFEYGFLVHDQESMNLREKEHDNCYTPYQQLREVYFRFQEITKCKKCEETYFLAKIKRSGENGICWDCNHKKQCESCGENFYWYDYEKDYEKEKTQCKKCLKTKGEEK